MAEVNQVLELSHSTAPTGHRGWFSELTLGAVERWAMKRHGWFRNQHSMLGSKHC